MGAVTALRYCAKDPTIKSLILDSPFYSLPVLSQEIASKKSKLPNIIVNGIIKLVR